MRSLMWGLFFAALFIFQQSGEALITSLSHSITLPVEWGKKIYWDTDSVLKEVNESSTLLMAILGLSCLVVLRRRITNKDKNG